MNGTIVGKASILEIIYQSLKVVGTMHYSMEFARKYPEETQHTHQHWCFSILFHTWV